MENPSPGLEILMREVAVPRSALAVLGWGLWLGVCGWGLCREEKSALLQPWSAAPSANAQLRPNRDEEKEKEALWSRHLRSLDGTI
jgi:hypothetical protein